MGSASEGGHVLVAGASGVIGTAAVERFARLGWEVTALSRREPVVHPDADYRHLPLDLDDPAGSLEAVSALPPVTHLVYAAVSEAPGLVSGWQDKARIEKNGRMFTNLLAPLAGTGALRHVSILQGGKAYGAHVHPVDVPLRESLPRDPHANFYWLHEDATRDLADEHGFAFTVWRPQILLGTAPGAAMNPVAAIGAYAALCKELDRPFALPGESEALWQMVDADLLARAFSWAAQEPAAAGETYNVTNGDIFVLRHAWPALADALGLKHGGTPPASFDAFFATAECQAAWRSLAARHGLRIADLASVLGESHHYMDLLTGPRVAAKSSPAIVSTIKLRQAGFADCEDSLASLNRQMGKMADLGLLPPDVRPAAI